MIYFDTVESLLDSCTCFGIYLLNVRHAGRKEQHHVVSIVGSRTNALPFMHCTGYIKGVPPVAKLNADTCMNKKKREMVRCKVDSTKYIGIKGLAKRMLHQSIMRRVKR
jgi:hypothetical protein